jgi:hypothetical protein
MFDPKVPVSWLAGLLWLSGTALVAFLVAWLLSDLRPTRRVLYIPILALVTASVTAAYLVWSQSGLGFWTSNWVYGLLGAAVAALFLAGLLSRRRVRTPETPHITAATVLWDGLVYGAAEGMLLSVLPVVITWQMLLSNGWDRGWPRVAAATLSILASVVVIVVHHLGYPDYRSSKVKLGQAILGCGTLSVAYLSTVSVIAPILAHAALHVVIVHVDMELPPHETDSPSEPLPRLTKTA